MSLNDTEPPLQVQEAIVPTRLLDWAVPGPCLYKCLEISHGFSTGRIQNRYAHDKVKGHIEEKHSRCRLIPVVTRDVLGRMSGLPGLSKRHAHNSRPIEDLPWINAQTPSIFKNLVPTV
ncbi:hypothetical protein RRG08_025605 [Elysia crispata]|uniref:Uncharacterized protein n=1 Tax=Elysia crispata TaxID=231223 RepID=A0AAE1CX89_9GAST|nr:hypothetical protein RRG08_025605 [Elysia crispata]